MRRRGLATSLATAASHESVSRLFRGEGNKTVIRIRLPSAAGKEESPKPRAHASYSVAWLRHNCRCDLCIQASSGQRLKRQTVYSSLSADSWEASGMEVRVKTSDGHTCLFPTEFLRANVAAEASSTTGRSRLEASSTVNNAPATFEYEELLASPAKKLDWMKAVLEVGVSLVKNVPREERGLERVVGLTGCDYSHTLYGRTFRVESTPNPINVAYSSEELEPHQDLAYYESPPGIQLLHAIDFDESIVGGESTFVDAHAAAEMLREEDYEAFKTLRTVPVTFQKDHVKRANPAKMVYRRPHIVTSSLRRDDVIAVFWAPPFEGPLDTAGLPSRLVNDYFRAYEKLGSLIRSSPRLWERHGMRFRLLPGDCVVFNNRRMLHGRGAFSGSGNRLLHGCYLEMDQYLNRLRVAISSSSLTWLEPRVGMINHR